MLAHDNAGEPFGEACDPAVRAAVDRKEISLLKVARDLKVQLALDALTVFARWITPAFMPKRFDTFF